MLGALLVQLPSVFTGGEIRIHTENEDEDCTTNIFQLGAGEGASFSCYFIAHYQDCAFEVGKQKSGTRILLRYSLCHSTHPAPTACDLDYFMSSIKTALVGLPPADRMLLIPMAKEYTAASLAKMGINALECSHRARFEALNAAVSEEWRLLLVTAQLDCTQVTGYYGDITSTECVTSVVQIFDEDGQDITAEEEWIKGVVDFEAAAEEAAGGMMLAGYAEDYCDTWGPSSCVSTSRYKLKRSYRASFILGKSHMMLSLHSFCPSIPPCDHMIN